MARFVRSQTVSVKVVKKGGLSTHPIGRASGNATKMEPALSLWGRTTPNVGTSAERIQTR
jgi:hypothetical protein